MENLYKLFTEFLDWWNKFSSRLRSIGYLIAVIFFILFLINNGCKRQHIEQLVKKMSGLDIQNDILEKKNKKLDNQLDAKDSLLLIQAKRLDSITNKVNESKNEIDYWKEEYEDIAERITTIPADSSYRFLQSKYDYPGKLKFPFNEPQVKGLHITYLQNKNRSKQLTAFKDALQGCEAKNRTLSAMKQTIEDKYVTKSTMFENAEEMNVNTKEKVRLLEKELKRNSKWFAGFGVGPNVSVSYINGSITPVVGIGIQYNIYKW